MAGRRAGGARNHPAREPVAPGAGSGVVSGTTVTTIVRRVHELLGDAGVLRMLDQAGETRSREALDASAEWSSYDQVVALFEAATEVTGDPDFARRCGEDMLRQWEASEVAQLLRSLGSPG